MTADIDAVSYYLRYRGLCDPTSIVVDKLFDGTNVAYVRCEDCGAYLTLFQGIPESWGQRDYYSVDDEQQPRCWRDQPICDGETARDS